MPCYSGAWGGVYRFRELGVDRALDARGRVITLNRDSLGLINRPSGFQCRADFARLSFEHSVIDLEGE